MHPAPGADDKCTVIPEGSHLIVTTPNYVYSWDNEGLTQIFRSESGGIIAAKEAHNGSATLAVADSQVVILHDVKRGMERSYKLKGTEGQVHLLQYANHSNTLFFTTSLQNAVQSYSLTDSRLLDPAHAHPTPPTVFAVSPTSHLLLSASDSPPTTYLHDLRLRRSPLLLQPSASDAAVIVAAFHPEQHGIFLLGFADGTLAAYNARFVIGGARKERLKIKHTYSGRGGEIGHFKKLHVTTSKGAADPDGVYDAAVFGGYDEGTATASAGSQSLGITGAAFLPGYHCKIITAGGDGRCRIVDFADGGRILRTWHLQAAASCLSILAEGETGVPVEAEQSSRRRRSVSPRKKSMPTQSTPKSLIAIGRDDGMVQLYDGLGLQLFEKQIDTAGGRIIDVEWVDGPGYRMQPDNLERVKAEARVPRPPPKEESRSENAKGSKRGRIGSLLGTHRKIIQEVITAEDATAGPAVQRPEHNEESNGVQEVDGTVRRRSIRSSGQPASPPAPVAQHTDLFPPTKQPRLSRRQSIHRPRVSSITFEDATTAQAGSPFAQNEEPVAPTTSAIVDTKVQHQSLSKISLARKRREMSFIDYRKMPGAYISTSSLASNGSGEYEESLRDPQSCNSKGAKQHIPALSSFATGIPGTATQEPHEDPSPVEQSFPTNGRLSTSQADVNAWLTDNEAHDTKSKANAAKRTARSRQPSVANAKPDHPAAIDQLLAYSQEKPLPPPPIFPSPPPPPPPPSPLIIPPRSAEPPVKFKLRKPSISPRKLDRALTEISHNSRRQPQTDKRLSLPVAPSSAEAETSRGEGPVCPCKCEELREEIRLLREQMHADILAVREEMAEGFRRQREGFERLREEAREGGGSWDS